MVLVLGSFLEGEVRKVGWGGEHLSLWSWITAGLWPVAPGFPRDGSPEESHRVKMSLWRKSVTAQGMGSCP